MVINLFFSKIRGQTYCQTCTLNPPKKTGTLGFPSVTVSLPVVAQPCPAKSRIIPNRCCKSKKAKENRGFSPDATSSRLCPFPLALIGPDGANQTRFSELAAHRQALRHPKADNSDQFHQQTLRLRKRCRGVPE